MIQISIFFFEKSKNEVLLFQSAMSNCQYDLCATYTSPYACQNGCVHVFMQLSALYTACMVTSNVTGINVLPSNNMYNDTFLYEDIKRTCLCFVHLCSKKKVKEKGYL